MSTLARGLCQAMVRFMNRRFAVGRAFNKRFAFSLAVLSVLSSKIIHIHTHVTALSRVHLLRWGYSFFAQDLWMLIVIRLLVDGWVASAAWPVRALAATVSYALLSFVIGLGILNVSFFVMVGSEIRWSNVGLASDPAWWGLMLSGLLVLSIVVGCGLVAGWFFQDSFFGLFGFATDLIRWPVLALLRRAPAPLLRSLSANARYERLPGTESRTEAQEKTWLVGEDDEDDDFAPLTLATVRANLKISKWRRWVKPVVYLAIGISLAAEVVMFTIRPHESSLIFMSWTSALLPFVDFSNSSPNLANLAIRAWHQHWLHVGQPHCRRGAKHA